MANKEELVQELLDLPRQFIIEKRKALGLTQEEFTQAIFGSKEKVKWISNVECGRRNISWTSIASILVGLNCSINFVEN